MSLLAVCIPFVAGQVPAWLYMRSGRVALGLLASGALWVLCDWWLVARYVYAHDEDLLRWPAGLLQLVAAGTAFGFAWQRWRRRWSTAAGARTERFAAGMAQYLRSDYPAARATFRRLVRVDPWDAPAWVALGDVLVRQGAGRAARGCYRRARAVDTEGALTDLIDQLRSPAVAARAPVASRR